MRMISVSAGKRSPSRCARGSSTALLWAVRTRRSSAARRPSRDARSSRRSASARAELSAEVWRAMTAQSAASSATSQQAIQCRPLNLTGGSALEPAELRRTGARIGGDFVRVGNDRLLREHAPERPAAAGAHGLAWRADALARPFPNLMLDDAVLTRVIRDDAQPPAGLERVAQGRQRGAERFELAVDRDAQRLKQPREIGRPRARAQDGADRVHEVIADRKRR